MRAIWARFAFASSIAQFNARLALSEKSVATSICRRAVASRVGEGSRMAFMKELSDHSRRSFAETTLNGYGEGTPFNRRGLAISEYYRGTILRKLDSCEPKEPGGIQVEDRLSRLLPSTVRCWPLHLIQSSRSMPWASSSQP